MDALSAVDIAVAVVIEGAEGAGGAAMTGVRGVRGVEPGVVAGDDAGSSSSSPSEDEKLITNRSVEAEPDYSKHQNLRVRAQSPERRQTRAVKRQRADL